MCVSIRKPHTHMGSVLALSSSPGHQNWPFSTEPPLSRWDTHPAHWDSPPRWERKDGRLPNPGSFHSLHRSCKGILIVALEALTEQRHKKVVILRLFLNQTSSIFRVFFFVFIRGSFNSFLNLFYFCFRCVSPSD